MEISPDHSISVQQPTLILDSDQQNLLLAALSSNRHKSNLSNDSSILRNPSLQQMPLNPSHRPSSILVEQAAMYQSPQKQMPSGAYPMEGSSLYLEPEHDVDGSFDFDDSAFSEEQLIETTPHPTSSNEGEDGDGHDKRKATGDSSPDGETDAKRREGDEKQPKKPGRKPLTSEPTSKRKAQNRAAQRAFRDRKEKHLKDLEIKVGDLEKASESANHENGLLRAQVDRLSMELKDYRKRLSLNAGGTTTRSPPLLLGQSTVGYPTVRSGPFGNASDFSFDFPTFGAVPLSPLHTDPPAPKTELNTSDMSTYAVPSVVRLDHQSPTLVTQAPQDDFGHTDVDKKVVNLNTSLDDLFSPSIFAAAASATALDFPFHTTTTTTRQDLAPVRSGSNDSNKTTTATNSSTNHLYSLSSMTSPSGSTSSNSHKTSGSSCGTSPESSTYSPITGSNNKPLESSLQTISEEHQHITSQDQVALHSSSINDTLLPLTKTPSAIASDLNSIDWLAVQNGGQFDPQLFGDYREPQNAIVAAAGSSSANEYDSYFNEAFSIPDLASPFQNALTASLSNTSSLPTPSTYSQPTPREGKTTDPANGPVYSSEAWYPRKTTTTTDTAADSMMSPDSELDLGSMSKCKEALRHHLGRNPGLFDLDALCADMHNKAKCSEGNPFFATTNIDPHSITSPAFSTVNKTKHHDST